MLNSQDDEELPPLKIRCTGNDCDHDLHCFLKTRSMAPEARGTCRECGADLVDWDRVQAQCLDDVAYTFKTLKYEYVRHHFWHAYITPRAINYARRKGREGLRRAAEGRVRSSVGKARADLFRDGTQTTTDPEKMDLLHYAQHATAACCRKCMEEWHGISPERALRDEEVAYLTALLMLYVGERLPDLAEQGVKIAPIRKPSTMHRAQESE